MFFITQHRFPARAVVRRAGLEILVPDTLGATFKRKFPTEFVLLQVRLLLLQRNHQSALLVHQARQPGIDTTLLRGLELGLAGVRQQLAAFQMHAAQTHRQRRLHRQGDQQQRPLLRGQHVGKQFARHQTKQEHDRADAAHQGQGGSQQEIRRFVPACAPELEGDVQNQCRCHPGIAHDKACRLGEVPGVERDH